MKPSERVGMKFGKLTIIRFSHSRGSNYWYVCQCDCGNIKTIEWGGLRRKVVTTCGCGRKDKAEKSMVGKRFGRFMVNKVLDRTDQGEFLLECLCDCGTIFSAITSKIRRGKVSSCGCKRKNKYLLDEFGNLRELSDLDKVIRKRLISYKSGARKRNIEFMLSAEHFRSLVSSPCFYCDSFDIQVSSWTGKRYRLNGIDRLDSSKEYSIKNSVPCCIQCNRAKLDYSHKDFVSWISRVHKKLFVG